MKSSPVRLSCKCPECGQILQFDEGIRSVDELDEIHPFPCHYCTALLVIEDSRVFDFDKKYGVIGKITKFFKAAMQ